MSQLLINDYLKQLALIRQVSGSQRETVIREAFKDLLKAWGKQQGLVFLAEYPLKTATKTNIAVDGALLHELRMPMGYWEAKDADDDLDEEVGRERVDNITDWALKQFTAHYTDETGKGKGARKITKDAIFHYCYAVLHDPLYREKYAQNLKREFPRTPFYAQLWQWAAWGEELMALHIGFESVQTFALTRHDEPDTKARAAGLAPKALLKSDPAADSITLDNETMLRGVPPDTWVYKIGNRCAIDWVLDQHKEKKPKDPTIREKFDTYRFADHKEKVIDLLARVTTVSVETVKITETIKGVARG